jgi:hypothetical protein
MRESSEDRKTPGVLALVDIRLSFGRVTSSLPWLVAHKDEKAAGRAPAAFSCLEILSET